jgi:type I restriction enzyme S subunit
MSEKALLARFDLVADNTENIALLRRYIVDLAIRGKLLEKSPLDISASEILKCIDAKADSLVKQGKLKKQKTLAPISAEELPATYVAHCTFERLGNVANLQKGLTGIQSAIPGEFPLVVTSAARSTCDHYDFDGAAAIVPMVSSTGHGHASLNRLHYQEGKFALGSILCAVFPIDEELVSARFIFEYLTAFKDELLVSKMNGTANVTLTVGKIAEVPVPIIAPVVQQRVGELMALCDQLEAAQNERELRRDRLVASSLGRIGEAVLAEPSDVFADAAHFHLNQLPRLTTRSEHIKQLRKTILNLALHSKLVDQNHEEGNADSVIEAARRAKDKVLEEWKFRPFKLLPPILSDELSFEIPKSWRWERIGNIAAVKGGKRLPKGAGFSKERTPYVYIRVTDMKNQTVAVDDLQYIDEKLHRQLSRYIIEKTDVYIVIVGATIGKTGIIPPELHRMHLTENAAKLMIREIYPKYLLTVLQSDFVQSQFIEKTYQQAQPKLALERIESTIVPIPPLAEQHRIVARVDELMALCDQLETQITTTQTDSRRLLEAVLHEALVI